MNRIKVRDIELAFEEAGRGPAIVLLHGYPFDRSMWREQIESLSANGYCAIAPDLRGLGESTSSGEIATMDEMARDVAGLLDELRIAHAVIVGLSMGGYVAFEFVHQFPARVQALVLAGTRSPADNQQEKQNREQQAQRMLAEGMLGIAEPMLAKLLARQTVAEKPDVVARVRAMILRTDPKGAAAAQRGMAARRDYSVDLPRIRASTLIIAGRADTIRTPDDAEFMHRGIRNSRLEIVDDSAHLTNMEQPGVFTRVLLDFLERSVQRGQHSLG
jgi:pimeloyl-ACP methyl ester carboxylesterase